MLVGVLIFAGGFYLGNLGTDSDTVDVGGGTFGAQEDPSDSTTTTPAESTTTVPVSTETAAPTTTDPPTTTVRYSDLPVVFVTELPVEALDTLDLIDSGGPFPFDRDGLTFQNREGLLPDFPRGHYQEFTVITPGASTRGARRIVAGADGELYYTADHYNSFREILPED